MKAHERIIFPLDVDDLIDVDAWCDRLQGKIGMVKIGLQLFTKVGPRAFEAPQKYGIDVMLDLKLHDIPNTVARAARNARRLGAKFITVHASGGREMIKAAVNEHHGVLAVTVLTSLDGDDVADIYGNHSPSLTVERMAKVARAGEAPGFVCSPKEVGHLLSHFPAATFVVPGVRPEGARRDDQKRVATPAAAVQNGATYLVIGRPIREAENPEKAVEDIVKEIEQA